MIRIWEVPAGVLRGRTRLSNLVEYVNAGDVVLLRNGLQDTGLWNHISGTMWKSVADAIGGPLTARLRKAGLVRMHELLTGEEIKRCNEAAHLRFNKSSAKYVPGLVRDAAGYSGAGYYDGNAVIRFYTPAAFHMANREVMEIRPGYTKPQAPHVDTWFGHATAGLNVWMAIEPVQRGHGMAIFTDKWGTEAPHDGNFRPVREQHYGKPVTFEMAPGDVLFFHGEHLHSSELNSTASTRVVLTNRFSIIRPRILSATTMAEWTELPRAEPAAHPVALEDVARAISPEEFRSHYTDGAQCGTVRALDDRWCEVNVGSHSEVVARICPHEGGDLSMGYVQNGRLHCPWHHLSFDPATGESSCKGIPRLRKRDS